MHLIQSQCFYQIDKAQDEVESTKQTASANNSASIGILYEAREKRNSLQNKLELILTARETIMENMDDLPQDLDQNFSGILQEYIIKRRSLQKLKDERSKLTQQKV